MSLIFGFSGLATTSNFDPCPLGRSVDYGVASWRLISELPGFVSKYKSIPYFTVKRPGYGTSACEVMATSLKRNRSLCEIAGNFRETMTNSLKSMIMLWNQWQLLRFSWRCYTTQYKDVKSSAWLDYTLGGIMTKLPNLSDYLPTRLQKQHSMAFVHPAGAWWILVNGWFFDGF